MKAGTLELPIMICEYCGHKWNGRVETPRCCPRCKKPIDNKPVAIEAR